MKKLPLILATSALLAVPSLATWSSPASAKGGDAVVRSGNCSGATDWKLKAKARDGGLEVEYEVDSNRAGQVWTYSVRQNGAVVASGTRTTAGPSGSFSVERRVANKAGTDVFVGTATNKSSGETCRGSLSI